MQGSERSRLAELRLDLKEGPLLGDGYPRHWGDPEIAEYLELSRQARLQVIDIHPK